MLAQLLSVTPYITALPPRLAQSFLKPIFFLIYQDIRFKDHGIESLEVIDNGSGLDTSDYETLGKASS
jgi:hypothetical protein